MARLFTSGGETADRIGEGLMPTGWDGAAATFATTPVRSGGRSYRHNPAANRSVEGRSIAAVTALARNYYARAYVYIASAPTDTCFLLGLWANGTANYLYAGITTSRTVFLSNTGVNLGTDATVLNTGQWYRFELRGKPTTGATDEAELRVYDGDAPSPLITLGPYTGQTITDAAWSSLTWGCDGPTTYNADLYFDDLGFNDDQGAAENTWCGPGRVYWLPAASDTLGGTSEANWTKPGGATTTKFDAVDNVPPIYGADSTNSAQAGNMLRNATSAASDNTLTTATYASAAGSEVVKLVMPVAVLGNSSTVAKGGTLGTTGNPTITAITAAFPTVVASATASTWTRRDGTIVYAPSLTMSSGATMRLSRATGTGTALVNAMGMLVESTPAATTVDQSGTDTAAATDARTTAIAATVTEAPAATDATSTLARASTVTDAAVATDTAALQRVATVTDSATAADATSASALAATLTDPITATDTAAVAALVALSATDAVTATDATAVAAAQPIGLRADAFSAGSINPAVWPTATMTASGGRAAGAANTALTGPAGLDDPRGSGFTATLDVSQVTSGGGIYGRILFGNTGASNYVSAYAQHDTGALEIKEVLGDVTQGVTVLVPIDVARPVDVRIQHNAGAGQWEWSWRQGADWQVALVQPEQQSVPSTARLHFRADSTITGTAYLDDVNIPVLRRAEDATVIETEASTQDLTPDAATATDASQPIAAASTRIDAAAATDSSALTPAAAATDAIAATDASSMTVAVAATDAIASTDASGAGGSSQVGSDTAVVTDQVGGLDRTGSSDVIIAADAGALDRASSASDDAAATDSSTTEKSIPANTDVVGATDAASIAAAAVAADAAAAAELASLALVNVVSDQGTVTDARSALTAIVAGAEAIVMQETASINAAGDVNASPGDASTAADASALAVNGAATQPITASELAALAAAAGLLDLANAADAGLVDADGDTQDDGAATEASVLEVVFVVTEGIVSSDGMLRLEQHDKPPPHHYPPAPPGRLKPARRGRVTERGLGE